MNERENRLRESGPGTDVQQTVVTSRCDRAESESLIHAIATAVSKATGKGHTEMSPLYDTIDADALAALFETRSEDSDRFRSCTVYFQYEGCDVTVFADGVVDVRRPEP